MKTSNLILHAGGQKVDLEQVYGVTTPGRTDTWVPIAHGNLLDRVRGSLQGQGLRVVAESHALARDGLRYFGLLQVARLPEGACDTLAQTHGHDHVGEDPDDFGLVVGVRNSHDRSYPAGLVLGASVFVCDNLSFCGEVKLARKHTAYIERDLPQLVDRAVGLLGGLRKSQEDRFAAYKRTEVSDREAHDFIISALDARIIGATRIPDLLRQWRRPDYPEFAAGGRTAWRLFNGFTEVLKGCLAELPRRTQALHGLLDSRCGLVLPGIAYRTDDAEIQVAQAG
jgi:hypothetical protein